MAAAGTVKDVHARLAAFGKALPAMTQSFKQVTKAATEGPRFSTAQKELFAAAIAVAQGCEDCILYHVHAAKGFGAEREDFLELLAVAVETGGGPAMVYGAKALAAFDETTDAI